MTKYTFVCYDIAGNVHTCVYVLLSIYKYITQKLMQWTLIQTNYYYLQGIAK